MHPTSQDEFIRRFRNNENVTGFGDGTTVHMPCMFCGAADCLVYRILDMTETINRGAVCGECGRGIRGLVLQSAEIGVELRFFQTVGPDGPDWMTVRVPRWEDQ